MMGEIRAKQRDILMQVGNIFEQTAVQIENSAKEGVPGGVNKAELRGMGQAYLFASKRLIRGAEDEMYGPTHHIEELRMEVSRHINRIGEDMEAEGDEDRHPYNLAYVQVLSFCYTQAKIALATAGVL